MGIGQASCTQNPSRRSSEIERQRMHFRNHIRAPPLAGLLAVALAMSSTTLTIRACWRCRRVTTGAHATRLLASVLAGSRNVLYPQNVLRCACLPTLAECEGNFLMVRNPAERDHACVSLQPAGRTSRTCRASVAPYRAGPPPQRKCSLMSRIVPERCKIISWLRCFGK